MAVDKFKKDMVSYMNLISEKGKEAQRGLEISYDKYYMTKEEKEIVIKEIHEVLQKYTKEDTTKEVYSMIHTLARIK
jgi:outer membrane protein assembly factor BamD (BamD/ComL family)